MNQALEARAEILKLARLLGADPSRLTYLEATPPTEIRTLREAVTDMLYDANDATLSRLVSASRLLPVALVALIGERAFGPMLAARLAGRLDPTRAVETASRLPTPFLAEVAVELDPRRAEKVISQMPPERIVEITRELARRGEFVAMGRFVGYLPTTTLAAAVGALSDADLLRAAFVMEQKDRLDELVGALGDSRVGRIIDAALAQELWVEVIDLLGHLSLERRAALVASASAREDEVLAAIVGVAAEHGLWRELVPLLEHLDEDVRRRAADLTAELELGDAELGELIEALAEHESGLSLLGSLDDGLKQRLVGPLGEMDARRRAAVATRARDAGVLEQLGPLRALLSD